ncbi:amino acid transporter [Amylostereum chailletii]|nr:amino acid transporter [Amylostereum chailletii]
MSAINYGGTSSSSSISSSTPSSTSKAQVDTEVQEVDVGSHIAPGAPVERHNPLGRNVTLWTAIMLNLGALLGPGIFAVTGVILNSVGSVGLLLTFWLITPIFAFAAVLAFGELASMFPDRSGATVVYLEQAYPRPKFFVPIAFAVTSVLTSFSGTSSVVFAQYVLSIFDLEVTPYRQTVLALAVAAFGIGVVGTSTKWSLRAVNILTIAKVLSLIFVALTGIAVLAGFTRIEDPFANFQHLFRGSSTNLNALATALVKTHWAFYGWVNSFSVLSEIKTAQPARTARNAALISVALVTLLFFFVNVAYVASVPIDEIKGSGQLVASLMFKHVFGESWTAKCLPVMVALSCLGNIIAITVGQARVLREVARQGMLPYPQFFASTHPFGTPLGPVLIKLALTVTVILLLPAKDTFNFLLDLASYPNLVFQVAAGAGVWVLRRRRAKEGLPRAPLEVWNVVLVLYLAQNVVQIVVPWVPPEPGHADVSFWYATYCVVGLGILVACAVYYYIWIIYLPRRGGYEIVEKVVDLGEGAFTSSLTRKYHGQSDEDEDGDEEERPLLAGS